MKIFFIIPPQIHYMAPYAYVKADRHNAIRPSLGLLYVSASLRRSCGITPRIIDAIADRMSLADLETFLKSERPDIVGFSVLTFNLLNCLEVARVIRRVSPETKICFGGWHPTLYPKETTELGEVDCVVVGEGEETFAEFVTVFRERGYSEYALSPIKGIAYKNSAGAAIINAPRGPVMDLNQLPFPAYDLVSWSKYSNLLACDDESVNVMTSRGCPQRCSFCDQRGTPYRFRSPENIRDEMKIWIDKGVREFFIQDDNFTINRKRAIAFCRLVIEAGWKIRYKISSRVDYLDEELLGYLKKSGCYRIYFGVESGAQKTLDYFEKGITVQQIRDVFRNARRCRIDRCAYIMIGAPTETRDNIEETLRLIREIRPDHLHCSVCTPMPETHLYKKLLADGWFKRDIWRDFARHPRVDFVIPLASPFFSGEQLRAMQEEIQRKFYWNPAIILREAAKTSSAKQFLAKARMAADVFFRK